MNELNNLTLALRETWFDKIQREAKEEAKEEAEEKAYQKEVRIVLNMIKDNLSDEKISNYSEFPLEEIEKIREEHSNQ